MRDKIQALKVNYKTTVDWHLNTGILKTKDFNSNHITTICPFFKELDKIFGTSSFKTLENQTNWNNSPASYSISLQKERSNLNKTALEINANVEKEKIKLNIRKKEFNEFVEKVKLCMNKKKLEIERKKLEQEAMIKLKEIESKERIETLRIKRKFELTKYELELKYKCIKVD
ncbi:uncharacterized protein LOC119672377 [Teleopsis dalmanni]|uniref:uncharacterized protein LOC119672023 n=1 Tax=Teleopsis dalmanni TaxID=139649 RepID=UPI0018CD5BD2|nr:uncharacterized protein LOC119672023 [Teleopsis dalmanni]XP_037939334.1 uncharacterized protein LOC119672377 [Teleopsis dalmanni]